MVQRLRWHLHDLVPALEPPAQAFSRRRWRTRVADALAALPQTVQTRIAAEQLERVGALCQQIDALKAEIATLVGAHAAALRALPGCGPLTAAKLVGEIAGVERFATPAKLARYAGVAPIPASSGTRVRHRLDRHGNRQLNCALHRLAMIQGRYHEPARAFLARKEAEGRTRREAMRSLKRHLVGVVFPKLATLCFPTCRSTLGSLRSPPSARGGLTVSEGVRHGRRHASASIRQEVCGRRRAAPSLPQAGCGPRRCSTTTASATGPRRSVPLRRRPWCGGFAFPHPRGC